MNILMKWSGICFSSLLLSTVSDAQEVPALPDISFTHPILDKAYVSSAFGMREDPFRKRPSWHGGIDLGAKWDAPIHAPADGQVIYANTKAGYGKMVDLQVSEDWVIRFAHMSEIEVEVGDELSPGDILGAVGAVGRSTGPHLHLEARYADKQYDPQQLEGLRLFETEKTRPN